MTDDIAPYLLRAHSRTLLRVRLSLIVKEEPSPDFRELLQLRLPLGDNALDLLVIRRFHSLFRDAENNVLVLSQIASRMKSLLQSRGAGNVVV